MNTYTTKTVEVENVIELETTTGYASGSSSGYSGGSSFSEIYANANSRSSYSKGRMAFESSRWGSSNGGEKYDDFRKIWSIGRKIQEVLYEGGITTYKQLADATDKQLNDILDLSLIHI